MSPGSNERAPANQGSHKSATTPANKPEFNRPSQTDRVKAMLARGWMCGVSFLSPPDGMPPILRYTGRIHELRRDGYLIDRRPCAHPWHNHEAQMWEWRLVGEPGDAPTLPGIGG